MKWNGSAQDSNLHFISHVERGDVSRKKMHWRTNISVFGARVEKGDSVEGIKFYRP